MPMYPVPGVWAAVTWEVTPLPPGRWFSWPEQNTVAGERATPVDWTWRRRWVCLALCFFVLILCDTASLVELHHHTYSFGMAWMAFGWCWGAVIGHLLAVVRNRRRWIH